MASREYRKLLSNEEKEIYDKLLEGFLSLEPAIYIDKAVKTNDIEKIFNYIILDNPTIYFVEKYMISQNNLGHVKINPEYHVSLENKKKYDKKVDEIIRETAEKIDKVKVVCGFCFVPEDESYFADLNLHPNDVGFKCYFENLCRSLGI